MEPARYNPLLGRRLHRPPIIRSSRNRTNTRSSRLQSSHRSTTRLARRLPRLQKTRTTTTLFRNSTRMYGLNGEQIHSQQTTPLTRCLLARRTTRPPTRIPHYYIYTNPQTTLPRNTRHPRRNRSLPQTPHTLRLLEKYTPKKYPLRLRSRHDNLRNGRKTRHSPSPRTRNRTTHQQHKKPATNRLPMSQKPNTRRNNRQRHNTPPTPRLPAQSQTPIRKLSPHRRRIKQNARPKNPPRSQRLYTVVNPPYPTMTTQELDASFDLPYTRQPHPKYRGKTIPAYEMIKYSVNIHRGCFGGCAFCTISAHQGKFISSRSKENILREVRKIIAMPNFKGYLSDLGGPSANMYSMAGRNLKACEHCKRPSCIHPEICPNLNTNHTPLLEIYKAVDALPGIKKSFIGSGVRYDLLLHQSKDETSNQAAREYTRELIRNHVSGRLKIAPEHTSDRVLQLMRKPTFKQFYQFKKIFDRINKQENLNQQIIPYFISSHPLQGRRHGPTSHHHQKPRLPPRTSTRFHPNANDCRHRDMVHRLRPLHTPTRLLGQDTSPETGPTTILLLV